jgi:hypothetical protein
MRPGVRHKLPNWALGLILIVVIVLGSLLAYTKTLPWSHAYTVKAVFSTSQNIAVANGVGGRAGRELERPARAPGGGGVDGDQRQRATDSQRRHVLASPAPVP